MRQSASAISGVRFLKHRLTGLSGPRIPVYHQDQPRQTIGPNEILWRYQDVDKLEDLLRSSSLYFRRVDKYTKDDPLEGSLSPLGIHGTSASDEAFNAGYKVTPEEYGNIASAQELAKRSTFINCWHINRAENARMWRAYTSGPGSVVVVTSFEALRANLGEAVEMYAVKYIDRNFPRTRFDHSSLFYYKDVSYEYESELRLLSHKRPAEEILLDDPTHFYVRVPIRLRFIHRVVCHPRMDDEVRGKTYALLRQFLPRLKPERSSTA